MSSAVGPVNEVDLQSTGPVPAGHHDIAGLEVPVAALLMRIIQSLQSPSHAGHTHPHPHACVMVLEEVPFCLYSSKRQDPVILIQRTVTHPRFQSTQKELPFRLDWGCIAANS